MNELTLLSTLSSSEDEVGTNVDVAVAAGFSTLVAAVKAASLVGTLSSNGPYSTLLRNILYAQRLLALHVTLFMFT